MMTIFRLIGVTLAILAASGVASARDAGERAGPSESAPVVQVAAPLLPPIVRAAAAAEIALPVEVCGSGPLGRNAPHQGEGCAAAGPR